MLTTALFMILKPGSKPKGPDGVCGGQPWRACAGHQAASYKTTKDGKVHTQVFIRLQGCR